MSQTLWNLLWALPLVSVLALVVILVLKRTQAGRSAQTLPRVSLRESLSVSERTQVHLIEVDFRPYLLVESDARITVQPTWQASTDALPPRALTRLGWMRRVGQGGS